MIIPIICQVSLRITWEFLCNPVGHSEVSVHEHYLHYVLRGYRRSPSPLLLSRYMGSCNNDDVSYDFQHICDLIHLRLIVVKPVPLLFILPLIRKGMIPYWLSEIYKVSEFLFVMQHFHKQVWIVMWATPHIEWDHDTIPVSSEDRSWNNKQIHAEVLRAGQHITEWKIQVSKA